MKNTIMVLFTTLTVCALFAQNSQAERVQCWTAEQLTVLDKKNVAGGKGTLHGEFAFTRDVAKKNDAIKEIGWMTLKHGEFIGLHTHKDNEDAYLIISGRGIFTDGNGNAWVVGHGDMTIARPGQSHGLANLDKEDLVFLDIIAKNDVADIVAMAKNPCLNVFLQKHFLPKM